MVHGDVDEPCPGLIPVNRLGKAVLFQRRAFCATKKPKTLDCYYYLYYIVYMVYYEKAVQKAIVKGDIPKQIIKLFHNAFLSLDLTNDLNLFDIKKMKGNYKRDYFRLRKGKFRAIFYIENNDFYVVYIGKRDEVYELWQ